MDEDVAAFEALLHNERACGISYTPHPKNKQAS
jgi:hypothetical protein